MIGYPKQLSKLSNKVKISLRHVPYHRMMLTNPSAANLKKEIKALHASADQLMLKKEFFEAITPLEKIICLDPNNIDAYIKLGGIHYLRDEYALTVLRHSKAIDLGTRTISCYSERAYAYNQLGKNKEALADLLTIKSLKKLSIENTINLAICYRDLGDLKNAIAELKTVIATQDTMVYLTLGETYMLTEAYPKAIKCFQALEKLNSSFAFECCYNLGLAYRELDDLKNSIKYFEKARLLCKNTDDHIGMLKDLAFLYLQTQNFPKAILYLEIIIKIAPDLNSYKNLGYCYLKIQQYEKSIEKSQEALKFDLTDKEVLENIDIAKENQFADQTFSSLQLQSTNWHFEQGITCLEKQNFSLARAHFIRVNQLNGYAYRELSIAYEMNGDLQKALSTYNRCIKYLIQRNIQVIPEHYYERGVILYKLKKYSEALKNFTKATKEILNSTSINRKELKFYLQQCKFLQESSLNPIFNSSFGKGVYESSSTDSELQKSVSSAFPEETLSFLKMDL